jgi:outer membrane scaffolding protein for murein synthesis (MipA/OmpV family)
MEANHSLLRAMTRSVRGLALGAGRPSGDRGAIAGRLIASGVRALCVAGVVGAILTVAGGRVWAQDSIIPSALPEGNLVAIGVGAYPDYVGSNDYSIGAIPLVRYEFWGKRDITLIGNTLNVNLLDTAGWRLGPSGMLRFGRSDVADDVVNRVHEVDPSIDLGAFIGYTWVGDDPRKRVGTTAWVLGDVTDSHGGWTAGANIFGAYPVLQWLTLVGGGAATYGSGAYMTTYFGVTAADAQASGLSVYQPDAGIRDVRGWLVALVHLSPRWTVGAGAVYSWLADEAGRSPIVSDRGSRNQWIYGIGAMFLW